jgi:hypothetical protein
MCSDHPAPIGREAEDGELVTTGQAPGGRQMWYEVTRTTSLHTKGQQQRRVEEWAYGQWYSGNPCYKAGTSIMTQLVRRGFEPR